MTCDHCATYGFVGRVITNLEGDELCINCGRHQKLADEAAASWATYNAQTESMLSRGKTRRKEVRHA
jgi:hypothetical protein|tara:strand:+ start:54 stop:254 length:201 start_codon:yes stop_codon:yes gene_type:complete